MHGWLPSRFNNHVGLLAQHKKHGMETTLSPADLRRQQETEPQWVAREDQARFLRENGYAKVEAIGLPFVYLPDVDIARRPGSLLVLPPHGRARHKAGDAFADSYADAVFALKPHFETIVACVTERDLARDEWRPQFAARGIPVVKGSDHSDPGTLLRMKRLFSSFDFATTNAFGSAIAYAAHCGVKVSVHGPYADWDVMQATHATILYPELPTLIAALYSEAALRASQEALFVNPWEALERKSWADSEIGTQHRKSPAELGRLFGWKA